MQNLPTAYLVGLVKKVNKRTKKSYYQLYFSSRVRQVNTSKKSYLKNSVNYTSSTRQNAHMRGYLTIWDDRNNPCNFNHPYFVECLKDHGLEFKDFIKDTTKKGLSRLPSPVPSEIFEFGSAVISRETGKPVPGVFEIIQSEQDDEQDLHLDNLTVAKLKDLADSYSITLPSSVKAKADIISFLKDQLA